MLLGRVIGNIWATKKHEKMEGLKLLIVQGVDLKLKPLSNFVIAVDAVSAGVGELVLVAQGSSARQTQETDKKPVDAVIMGIVDDFDCSSIKELDKEYFQRKDSIQKQIDMVSET